MADDAAAPPSPPSRGLRIWYGVVQSATIVVFASMCLISRKFEEIFRQLDLRYLPAPTTLVRAIAPFFRGPVGLGLLAVLMITLVVLGVWGTFDRLLRKLIVINVIGTAGIMGFTVLSLFVPVMRIQQVLNEK